jgi:hypothetical protein
VTGTDTQKITTAAAYQALTEHRFYSYRGCAADPDRPDRMAGNPDLPVGAHHAPDTDGGEEQSVRRAREDAAIEVCLSCPVMVACDAYASSITPDGKLAEPDGVQGGRRALERHRAFIKTRHEVTGQAPDTRFNTAQKRAVLRALAGHTDPYAVASAAEMDVRTANWQRSKLTTLLGLPHDATRAELLAAAAGRGLLDGVAVVADDGTVPAVPPPTRMPDPPEVTDAPVPADEAEPRDTRSGAALARAGRGLPRPDAVPYQPVRVPSPRRDRFTDVDGQLALWEAELSELAPVHDLFPATRLEAAA